VLPGPSGADQPVCPQWIARPSGGRRAAGRVGAGGRWTCGRGVGLDRQRDEQDQDDHRGDHGHPLMPTPPRPRRRYWHRWLCWLRHRARPRPCTGDRRVERDCAG
jgi:hypothetical protein